MYGSINLLNNEALFEAFKEAQGHEPYRLEILFEMARRVGTSGAMLLDDYREDIEFRASVDEDTVSLFKHYKLNGGQNDHW